MTSTDHEAARAAAQAARSSYGKIVACLAARTRDVAAAEDALADAFAAALRQWPLEGVPRQPEAWLLTVARRRQVDGVRAWARDAAIAAELAVLADTVTDPAGDETLPDHRLRLMLACAHPAIDPRDRAPLMLQTVLGIDAARIASAFLMAPSAMGQRLVRAKARIRQVGIPFEVPEPSEWADRLHGVLSAIYAAFAQGWADAPGADPSAGALADEALWLGRLVAHLRPDEPEALGLLALMTYADARRAARRDSEGAFVPLAQQDTARWDHARIDEAEALLRRASHAGQPGRFQLEAAIQSAHCWRRTGRRADPGEILLLYEGLDALVGTPVSALNRAVALAEVHGAAPALEAIDALQAQAPALQDYQPLWAARAHLHARLGEVPQAQAAYRRAIGLERDPAVRRFLQRRADSLGAGKASPA